MSSASELESSLISFAGSDSILVYHYGYSLVGNLVWVGGVDYSTEVVNGEMAIIAGNTVLLLDERVSLVA